MSKKIPNEIEFLKASTKGDITAFETIVKKYQSFICAITFSATGDVEKSEELAQEAFISAWKDLSQLQDLTKFRSWIGSIARNIIKNSFRSQKRDLISKSASMDEVEDVGFKDSGPVETAITKERQAVVRQALQQIPSKYSEPLVLFYRQQQSVKEVAEQLELSEAVVRQRLSRGRKLLKEQVAAMVETTISRTGPKKVFTTAVIASITGMLVKGSAVAAAGIAAASETPATAGLTTVMSSITAKIIAAAAVTAIGVGAVVTYSHMTKPEQEPDLSQAPITIRQQEERQNGPIEKATEQPGDEKIVLSAVDKTINNSKSEISIVIPTPPALDREEEYKFESIGVLSGLITDAETNEPVTGAKVYAVHVSGGRINESETDPNGFYCFKKIRRHGDYNIRIFQKEYVGVHYRDKVNIHLEKERQAVKDFKLQRACMIEISVVNEEGEPLAGTYFINTLLADENKREIEDSMHPEKTDANGLILLGGFKPVDTPYLIVARHIVRGKLIQKNGRKYYSTYRDYAPGRLEIILTDPNIIEFREIVLEKGISIAGYAEYLDGVPAEDLRISAHPEWWHSHSLPRDYAVDANGFFTLEHVLPGRYNLRASIPLSDDSSRGISLGDRELPLEEGQLLEIKIPEKSPQSLVSISGTINWVSENKPSHVYIDAVSPQGSRRFTSLARNSKGELENNFVIERLEPGIYTLRFSGSNIEDTTVRNVRAPGEGLVVDISTKRQTKLRGKVVSKETGEPVTGFEVGFGRDWIRFNHPEGEFELASVGTKCRSVYVRADGFTMKRSKEICPDANEPVVIELGIGGVIEGIVVDENRKPIQDAKISYRYKRSRNEKPHEKYITATNADGLFVIEDVPQDTSSQWFMINHPNYAPEIKLIEMGEDNITDVEIVLKKGGVIEGYVYDSKGQPIGDTTLYFLDESQYSYWKENRARLGSVTTDPNGYYQITRMPEILCFGFRHEPDNQLGVVRTAVLPGNGKTTRLDFGGRWYAAGRLLQDGKPVANTKVMVTGNTAGYETAFTAYAMTDSDGVFTFWGIPSGLRFMYWSIPGMRSWGQWIEMGRFEFESGVDLNLGDFEVGLSEVSVQLVAENPTEQLDQLDIFIQRYNEKGFWGRKAGQILPREDVNDPYIFSKLSPGIYEVIASRQNYPAIRKVFEIEQGQKIQRIDLWIPPGSASLSGKIIPHDPNRPQSSLLLRSVDQTITMDIRPAADGSYKIGNLPFGDYIIGKTAVALSRQSKLKEVSLGAGEHKNLDIEIADIGQGYDGYLVVLVVTEDGLPLAGTDVWLERAGKTVVPHFEGDKSKSLKGEPGEWILHAQHPGYKSVRQKVIMKSKKEYNTQEILKPVVITMSK
ncbi:MAG: sigma-70 family RNA polymerase sigma factor [Planctomycetota bacterium]|jgi:RNA polymerase sigma factor (sigma-70 family)